MAEKETPDPVWVVGQFIGRAPAGEDLLTFEWVYLEEPLRWQIMLDKDDPTKAGIGWDPLPGLDYVHEVWVRLDAANIVYEAGPEMTRQYKDAVQTLQERAGIKRVKQPTDADILHINSRGKRG